MSEQPAQQNRPQQPRQQAAPQPQGAARPPVPQQGRTPRADLSRDELRAHLANVESQIKSALRIIASESKGTQQAHSALRADLSSALVRLQADMNGSSSDLSAKIDRLGAEVSFLNRQRRIGRVIFLTFGMTLSFILGVLVIVSWLLIKEGGFQSTGIPVPIEEMFEGNKPGNTSTAPTAQTGALDQRPAATQQTPQSTTPAPAIQNPNVAPTTPRIQGAGILPPVAAPVERAPLTPVSPTAPSGNPAEQQLPQGLLTPNQPQQ